MWTRFLEFLFGKERVLLNTELKPYYNSELIPSAINNKNNKDYLTLIDIDKPKDPVRVAAALGVGVGVCRTEPLFGSNLKLDALGDGPFVLRGDKSLDL